MVGKPKAPGPADGGQGASHGKVKILVKRPSRHHDEKAVDPAGAPSAPTGEDEGRGVANGGSGVRPGARMGLLASTAAPPSVTAADFEWEPLELPTPPASEVQERVIEAEAGLRAQIEALQASLMALSGMLEDAIRAGEAHVQNGGPNLEHWKAKVTAWREALEEFIGDGSGKGMGLPAAFGRLAGRMASEVHEQQVLIEDLRRHLQEVNRKLDADRPSLEVVLAEAMKDPKVVERLEGIASMVKMAKEQAPKPDSMRISRPAEPVTAPSWRQRISGFLRGFASEVPRRDGSKGIPLDQVATRDQVKELEAWGGSLGEGWFSEIDRLSKRQPGFAALIRKSMVAPDVFGRGVEGQDFRRLTGGEAARLIEIVHYDPRPVQ